MTSFQAVSPGLLADRIADWAGGLAPARPRIGIDGDPSWGTVDLADAVAAALRDRGRPALAVSTRWWWRPAALRLELGREDPDMLRHGWVDAAALERELLAPFSAGRPFLARLRDPDADRSLRDAPQPAPVRGVLILHGPFLLDLGVPLDGVVGLLVSPAAVRRRLPADRSWWASAFADYADEHRPERTADLVVSFDHPRTPALRGPRAGHDPG